MAERMEVLFRVETPGKSRHIVLDGDPNPPMAKVKKKFCPSGKLLKYDAVFAQVR